MRYSNLRGYPLYLTSFPKPMIYLMIWPVFVIDLAFKAKKNLSKNCRLSAISVFCHMGDSQNNVSFANQQNILSEHQTVNTTAQINNYQRALVRAIHGWRKKQQKKVSNTNNLAPVLQCFVIDWNRFKQRCSLDDVFPGFNTGWVSWKRKARGNTCHHPLLLRKKPWISCVSWILTSCQ